MLASNMNGLEGLAYIIIAIFVFCLTGTLLVGPLAIISALIGGKLKMAAFILGIMACVIGTLGILIAGAFCAMELYFSQLHFSAVPLFLLPPSLSLLMGILALRLRHRSKPSFP